jgi:hypothetical protein
VTTNVNSFLASRTRSSIRNASSRHDPHVPVRVEP